MFKTARIKRVDKLMLLFDLDKKDSTIIEREISAAIVNPSRVPKIEPRLLVYVGYIASNYHCPCRVKKLVNKIHLVRPDLALLLAKFNHKLFVEEVRQAATYVADEKLGVRDATTLGVLLRERHIEAYEGKS